VKAPEGRIVSELPEDVLLVRRHDGNMTAGKSLVEVNTPQVFKRIRDLRNRRKVLSAAISVRNS
jgi:hypothetical protein